MLSSRVPAHGHHCTDCLQLRVLLLFPFQGWAGTQGLTHAGQGSLGGLHPQALVFCSSSLKLRWLRSAETQAYTSHIQHSIPYPGGVFLVLKLMSKIKMFKKEKKSCLGVPVLQLPVVPGSWVPLLVVTQLMLTCLTLVLSYFKNVELNQIPAFLSYNIWIALVKAMKKIILWWSLEILVTVSKFHNLFPVHIVMNSHYCLQSVE